MKQSKDNGLNLANKPENLVVENIGSFDPDKILEAMIRVAKENPGLRFRVIPHAYYEAVVETKENPD